MKNTTLVNGCAVCLYSSWCLCNLKREPAANMELAFFIWHFQVQVHWKCLVGLPTVQSRHHILCHSLLACRARISARMNAIEVGAPCCGPAARKSQAKQRRVTRVCMNGHAIKSRMWSYVVQDFALQCVRALRNMLSHPIESGAKMSCRLSYHFISLWNTAVYF